MDARVKPGHDEKKWNVAYRVATRPAAARDNTASS
jgi:hypothetical protein